MKHCWNLDYTIAVWQRDVKNIFACHLVNKWLFRVTFQLSVFQVNSAFLFFFNTIPKGKASYINVYYLTFIIICKQSFPLTKLFYLYNPWKPFESFWFACLRLSEYSLLSRQGWMAWLTSGINFINVKYRKSSADAESKRVLLAYKLQHLSVL